MRFLTVLTLLAAAAFAAEQGSFDRTLNVTGPVDLDVQTNSGSIRIRTGGDANVQIHGVIRPNNGRRRSDLDRPIRDIESHPPIQQAGNTIRIGPLEDERLRRRIGISYELTVPPQTKVRAHTGSGTIDVAGITGEVRSATGSGHIEVSDIKGNVDVHTGSGSIEGRAISGSISARTGSGRVRLEQTANGPLEAHTGSGSVDVRLPGTGGYDLYARTGSGRVHVEPPITVSGSINNHSFRGKLRGGGSRVDISTGSGSIRIE